jgi:hypothetical protein
MTATKADNRPPKEKEPNLGVAILSMYAAIKICRKSGIDPHDLVDFTTREVFSEGEYHEHQVR